MKLLLLLAVASLVGADSSTRRWPLTYPYQNTFPLYQNGLYGGLGSLANYGYGLGSMGYGYGLGTAGLYSGLYNPYSSLYGGYGGMGYGGYPYNGLGGLYGSGIYGNSGLVWHNVGISCFVAFLLYAVEIN